jgi:hypothetical protein
MDAQETTSSCAFVSHTRYVTSRSSICIFILDLDIHIRIQNQNVNVNDNVLVFVVAYSDTE